MPILPRRHRGTATLAVAWLAVAGLGMFELLRYSNTLGEPSHPPPRWPEGSAITRDAVRPTLVMLLHPQCPCSQASVEELAIVRASAGDVFAINLIFLASGAFETESSLWRDAQRIPGAVLTADATGLEMQRFGATTSGHVLVFEPRGDLIFSGGITSARGHAGPNRGRDLLLAIARGERPDLISPPAFGCALIDRRGHGGTEPIANGNMTP